MKAYGKRIFTVAVANSIMPVVTSMKGNFKTIWLKALVFIIMQTVQNISVIGNKTSNMVLERKNGMTAANTKDSIKLLQKKDKENTAGQMAIDMLENG